MHRLMMSLARTLAIIGGLTLSATIIMTCASIVGREINAFMAGDWMQASFPGLAEAVLGLGVGQVKGDAELVEAGMAFAIFSFLPLCQISAGHASVDIFANKFPTWLNRLLRALAEVGFAFVLILIAWKLKDGTVAKFRNGETSWLLQFPLWWAYALSLFAAVVAAIVAVYMAVIRCLEFLRGQTLLPTMSGADT